MIHKLKDQYHKFFHPEEGIKKKTLQGAILIFFGDGYTQGLKLAGNLIMTRLLYPEAFGLMLIVNLVAIGLNMLSDTGIRGAVILKSRGREYDFLNTAWSLLVIRGVVLTICSWILATPIAHYYNEPILSPLIMLVGISAVINGLASPHILLAQRELKLKNLVILEAIANTVSMAVTITWLYLYPMIWALPAHQLINSSLKSGLSFYFFPADAPKFQINRSISKEIFNYGKWIFLSTLITYLAINGDRLLLSSWVDAKILGVFSIALTFSKLFETIFGTLNLKLIFPVYAKLRLESAQRFVSGQIKVRGMIMICTAPIIFLMAGFGDILIETLYDERYHSAGSMLQILTIGSLFTTLILAIGPVFISHENSFLHMSMQTLKLTLLFITMTIGGYVAGVSGLIMGIAAAPALYYPILLVVVRRYNIILSWREIFIIFALLLSIGGVWMLRGMPGEGL